MDFKLSRSEFYALLTGVLVGFMSGLFGIGGGVLMVPALIWLVGMPQRRAHGTTPLSNVILAGSGVLVYILDGSVEWGIAALVLGGSVWGVVLGTHLLSNVNLRVLMLVFTVVALAGCLRLIFGSDSSDDFGFALWQIPASVGTGVLAGTLSGLLGIGGGIVYVPVLIIGMGFSSVVAKGTSLLIIVPSSLLGVYRNKKKDNIDLRIGFITGLAGVPLALLGAWVSSWISESLSRILLGALLGVIALRMCYRAVTIDSDEAKSSPASEPNSSD